MKRLSRVGMLALVLVVGAALVLPAQVLDVNTRLRDFLAGTFTGTLAVTGPIEGGNGTALLPQYSFAAEPTLGFWRSGAGTTTHQGSFIATGSVFVGAANFLAWSGRGWIASPANGQFNLTNAGSTIGSQLKVDSLPTIASGFGAGAAVTAGSTPFAGQVNTGAASASGVITFNGTAFPSTPFCILQNAVAVAALRMTVVATTTQMTINAEANWPANALVNWICISAK